MENRLVMIDVNELQLVVANAVAEAIKSTGLTEQTNQTNKPKYYTTSQAKEILNCSTNTLTSYRQKGFIKGGKPEGKWYYDVASVDNFTSPNDDRIF